MWPVLCYENATQHTHNTAHACMHVHFCCSKWAHKVPTQISTLWHPSGLLHHARTSGNRLSLVPNSDSSNFFNCIAVLFGDSLVKSAVILLNYSPLQFYMLILFLVCEEKSGTWHCAGFCGQTQARHCDMPVWHPVHFSSRRDRMCCCCDQDSGCLDIYPLSVKTPTTSLAHQHLLPPGTLAIPTLLCTCLN